MNARLSLAPTVTQTPMLKCSTAEIRCLQRATKNLLVFMVVQ